jgi:DNA-binding transcriptional LysR family regulator
MGMSFGYPMDSRSLRYFAEVVRLASISRAAEQMRVSQPAISRSIKQLEERLGVQLLLRTPAGVLPTEAGRLLYARAQSITSEINRAETEISALSLHKSAPVCVGVLRSQMLEFMPAVASRVLEMRPDIPLRLVEQSRATLLSGLLRGEFDLVVSVVRTDQTPSNLVQEALFKDRHSIIVREDHPALADLQRLSDFPWIVPPVSSQRHALLGELIRALNIQRAPGVLIECDSNIFLRSMVWRTDCVGIMPYEPLSLEIRRSGIALLPSSLPLDRTVSLLTRNDYPLSSNAAFVARIIHKVARDLADCGGA